MVRAVQAVPLLRGPLRRATCCACVIVSANFICPARGARWAQLQAHGRGG
jgi:hypothetical protein